MHCIALHSSILLAHTLLLCTSSHYILVSAHSDTDRLQSSVRNLRVSPLFLSSVNSFYFCANCCESDCVYRAHVTGYRHSTDSADDFAAIRRLCASRSLHFLGISLLTSSTFNCGSVFFRSERRRRFRFLSKARRELNRRLLRESWLGEGGVVRCCYSIVLLCSCKRADQRKAKDNNFKRKANDITRRHLCYNLLVIIHCVTSRRRQDGDAVHVHAPAAADV